MGFHTEADLRNLGKEVADAAYVAVLREQAATAAKSGTIAGDHFFRHYPELYASFATPDPAGMRTALDTLAKMSYVLTRSIPGIPVGEADKDLPRPIPDTTGVESDTETHPDKIMEIVDDRIRQWHGPARNAFHDNVVAGFRTKTGNQDVAIRSLGATLAVHMHLRKSLNEKVWEIGQKSIEQFNKVRTTSPGQAIQIAVLVGAATGTIWTVWGGVAAAGGIAAGLGKVTAKDGASIVTALNNIRNSPDIGESLKGGTAQDVDSSMKNLLSMTAKSYHDQEKEIIDAMNEYRNVLKNTSQQVELPAPVEVENLADDDVPTLKTQFHD